MMRGSGQIFCWCIPFLFFGLHLRQHRTIPALRLKHRSGSCGTASALPKCSIMSGCGTRIVLRGQKPLTLCDRCPCFGSLFPPLAALTFAASSIICAFGLAAAAPRSPYRHLELCGIALRRFSSCFGFQYLQRSGTVKTVPYRMFWGALLTCKISVGCCARRRVSDRRLLGRRWMPSSRRGETLPTAHYILQHP